MQSKRKISQLQPSHPIPLSQRNALPYPLREFTPIYWKKLPSDPWNRNGYENGSCICQHLHGGNRNKLINQNNTKPRKWKRYIDDIFSLWDTNIDLFINQANNFQPTIKFTAEISEIEITFLDTIIFKEERFRNESILDIRTHYEPTETFQYSLKW